MHNPSKRLFHIETIKSYCNSWQANCSSKASVDRDEIKERRNIMVSPSAWNGLDTIAKALGYKSCSDLIEAVGREEVELSKKITPDE